MNNIEQIKIDLTLKMLAGTLSPDIDIYKLPVDDSLRTFVCSLSPRCAYKYAKNIDEKPHPETRTAVCKDPKYAFYYALEIDYGIHNETRAVCYKSVEWRPFYVRFECACPN